MIDRLPRTPRLYRRLLPIFAAAAMLFGCPSLRLYRPNVVIVLIDALRADRLGVNGYRHATTPHIDRLAAEGVSFTTALAQATWTKPSIASLFTSKYPSQLGIHRVGVEQESGLFTEVLDLRHATLAESFQEAGYTTGAVINQIHLQSRFGFARGFEDYAWFRGKTAPQLNRNFSEWLGGIEGGPFLAYVHYLDVHWPYTSTLGDDGSSFGPTTLDRPPPHSAEKVDEEWLATLEDAVNLDALRARYDQEVAFADRAVGELVAELKRRGLYEDTIIVVTSDHGEGFLEHDRLQHGYDPYDELMRVPWVHRLPERLRRATGRIEVPVGLIDLMPTLIEQAGLHLPDGLEGRSLAPLLRGESLDERPVYAEAVALFAARNSRYKAFWSPEAEAVVFDLQRDPDELRPLEEDCGDACRNLKRQLATFARRMLEARAGVATRTERLTEEEIEELKSLGYL